MCKADKCFVNFSNLEFLLISMTPSGQRFYTLTISTKFQPLKIDKKALNNTCLLTLQTPYTFTMTKLFDKHTYSVKFFTRDNVRS